MAVERYGSSKTDVIVKLVLVFFISLLSFSIGTFVGKKFSDNQHKISQLEPQAGESKDEVATEEASKENREVASVPAAGEGTEVKPKDALNDDEIKKLAQEFVADDESAKKPSEAKPTEASAAPGGEATSAPTATAHEEAKAEAPKAAVQEEVKAPTAHVAKTESPAATRVVAGKTPEPEVAEAPKAATSRIPQSLPKELATTAIGKFTVQVASYPTEAEAEKMAADLKNKGFSAFYVTAQIKDKASNTDKTWYRVSVGIFTTQKEAEAYKADLLARAKVASAIVQKITN